jgi:hypothetical protein
MIKLYAYYVVVTIFLALMLIVFFNIRKVRIRNYYKGIIALSALVFAPGGYLWYRLAKRKHGVKGDPH